MIAAIVLDSSDPARVDPNPPFIVTGMIEHDVRSASSRFFNCLESEFDINWSYLPVLGMVRRDIPDDAIRSH